MEPASGPVGAPDWVLDVALAAMGIAFAAALTLSGLPAGIMRALSVHVFVSLYHGRFGRLRTVTWTILFGGWTVSFLIGFLGYVLPWGQMSFWVAAHLGGAFSNALWESQGLVTILTSVAGLLVMLGAFADVVALHAPRLRGRRRVALVAAGLLGLVIVAIAANDLMHLMNTRTSAPSPEGSVLQATEVTPSIGVLPLYSLLRAGPTKVLGAALPPTLAILVMLWPWRRAWRFHAAPTRATFTILWLGASAAWVGLCLLGAKAPALWVVAASEALALYELAFFAAMPFVLARFVRPTRDRRAEIF